MATQYPKVPQAKISSLDIVSFQDGLDQRGAPNITSSAFSSGYNAMVTPQGLITHRLGLRRWLPDVVGTAGAVLPAYYNGVMYYFTADNGVIRYIVDGGTSWTNCGGDNTVTTTGATNTFLRILDKILILNGVDTLGYVDLTTFNVVHFSHVNDPASGPTTALTVLTTGSYKVYYCISYNSTAGKTLSSSITTQTVNKIREQWSTTGSEYVTVTDPNTRPSGAVSWNVYLATAPAGGTIQLSDMLPIALGLDINTTTFVDNGSITQITNAGTAPTVNTTTGPKAKYGVQIEGRPFLYGITDDPYAVLIGGDDMSGLDFTEGNGGYRLVLNQGTDYLPSAIIGFRNGQGEPSITALYTSVSGISKASILEQNTVSLGSFSMVVWGSHDQNYGAAGVISPYAAVNYRGRLVFPSTDGITNIDTSRLRFNVLTATRISDPVVDEVSTIKNNLLGQIVGTAWANRIMFSIPARGYDYNNEILIYDVTNTDNPCWYTFDIRAQWIGTISPPNSTGFVYVAQDNHFFYLDEVYTAQDETATGGLQPFSWSFTTGVIGTNTAHNSFYAIVQAVPYVTQFVGSFTLTMSWRDYQSGKMKSRTKTFTNGPNPPSSAGEWSASAYEYNSNVSTIALRWGEAGTIMGVQTAQKSDLRYRLPVNNVITSEVQATISVDPDNTGLRVRSLSFEGQPLGVSPDVRG